MDHNDTRLHVLTHTMSRGGGWAGTRMMSQVAQPPQQHWSSWTIPSNTQGGPIQGFEQLFLKPPALPYSLASPHPIPSPPNSFIQRHSVSLLSSFLILLINEEINSQNTVPGGAVELFSCPQPPGNVLRLSYQFFFGKSDCISFSLP